MTATTPDQAPRLTVTDPMFSITVRRGARRPRGELVRPHRIRHRRAALRGGWRAHEHPSLRQGSAQWPAHNGVTEGPFLRWWNSWILNKEGEEHHRLRRLMNPAFSPKL